MFVRKSILAAGIGLAAIVGISSPAFAAGPPPVTGTVNVSATVPASLTMTGLSDINFGTVIAGQANTASETYNVTSNDPAGISISILPGTVTSGTLPVGSFSVAAAWTGGYGTSSANYGAFPAGGQAIGNVLIHGGSGGSENFTDTWTLTPPAGSAPQTYQQSFTYTATAN